MTKEEIIKKHLGGHYEVHDVIDWDNLIENAMDEWAAQSPSSAPESGGEETNEFLRDAVNVYWHQAVDKLNEKDLGDVERKNWREIKRKCHYFLFHSVQSSDVTPVVIPKNAIGFRIVKIRGDNLVSFGSIKLKSNDAIRLMINRLKLFGDFGKYTDDCILLDLLDEGQSIVGDVPISKNQYEYLITKFKLKIENEIR